MRAITLFPSLGGLVHGCVSAGYEHQFAAGDDFETARTLEASFPGMRVAESLVPLGAADVPHSDVVCVGTPVDQDSASARDGQRIILMVMPRAVILDCMSPKWSKRASGWLSDVGYRIERCDGYAVALRSDVILKTPAFPFPDLGGGPRAMSEIIDPLAGDDLAVSPEKLAMLAARNEKAAASGVRFKTVVLKPGDEVPRMPSRLHKSPYDMLVDDGSRVRMLSPEEIAAAKGITYRKGFFRLRSHEARALCHCTPPRDAFLLAEEIKVWLEF